MTPRFVPFESMSDAEQREHLRRMHHFAQPTRETAGLHMFDHAALHDVPPVYITAHTHDKPAPRPEENR